MDLFLDGGELEIEDEEPSDAETEAKQQSMIHADEERQVVRPPPAVGKVMKQPAHKVVGKQNNSANQQSAASAGLAVYGAGVSGPKSGAPRGSIKKK